VQRRFFPRFIQCFNTLAPLLFYLALSLVFFARKISWSGYYFGSSPDPAVFIWFLNWWPFAISHGLNPFICKYVWFPAGYNLAWATSVPFLAILAWPITALGGPVLSFNILTISAPAFAAWTSFLLCRELSRDWTAALVGGFLFGFSADEFWELQSELNLDTVFLIPLAVLLCVRRARGSLRRWPFIVSLSLVLLAQLGISTEVLATLCLLGALIWSIFLLFSPSDARAALWRLAGDIGISAPLVMVLAAPFLYYLVKGLPDVPQQIGSPFLAAAEPLQFIFPQIPIHSASSLLDSIAREFTGFTPENGAFIGIPLLMILALYFYRRIGAPHARALLLALCLTMLLSLGPVLHFNDGFTHITLPWALLAHVPFLRSLLPDRLLTYVTLETAIIAALWLAEEKRCTRRLWRFALAGLACIILVPTRVLVLPQQWALQSAYPIPSFAWTRWPVQPFFTPAHIRAALGPMPNVLLLPDPVFGPGMAWQLGAGMQFTQATGYVGFIPVHEQKWGALDDLFMGPPKPNFGTVFSAFCAAHRVDYVLIGPGTPDAVVNAIEALGWPHHLDDGIEVVKPPTNLQ
jgi:hypothetical protein